MSEQPVQLLCAMCLLEDKVTAEAARVDGTGLCAEHVTLLDPQSNFIRAAHRANRRFNAKGI